mmetsp:Transcript_31433/g.75989  ORF Transcript_31433/g.75989 Transcript_31433/m.75989 type:complete len:216 (-) Transcript_31433:2088-2735(-)
MSRRESSPCPPISGIAVRTASAYGRIRGVAAPRRGPRAVERSEPDQSRGGVPVAGRRTHPIATAAAEVPRVEVHGHGRRRDIEGLGRRIWDDVAAAADGVGRVSGVHAAGAAVRRGRYRLREVEVVHARDPPHRHLCHAAQCDLAACRGCEARGEAGGRIPSIDGTSVRTLNREHGRGMVGRIDGACRGPPWINSCGGPDGVSCVAVRCSSNNPR